MIDNAIFIINEKRKNSHKTLNIQQFLDWAKISIVNSEEIETEFHIEKKQLAELGILLFHIACTQRIGIGWKANEIVELLQSNGAIKHDLNILSDNLMILKNQL
jgi:hypothetical protein